MIDPQEFGALQARVDAHDREMSVLGDQIAELRSDVKRLVALAEQGRGALWASRGIYAVIGGAVAWVFEHWSRHP